MELAILIISAFITSSISAVIGMGGGIILLGIMAIIIPEGYMVIALHGIIQLISNTTRTYVFKNHLKKKLIKEFSIGSLAGAGLSALIIFLLMQFYGVEDNLITNIFNGTQTGGQYSEFLYLENPKTIAPFGLAVIKIVLNHNDVILNAYSIFSSFVDFNQIENIGQTDENGLFELDSSYRKYIPTFYDIPNINQRDEFGNFNGELNINDLIGGFEIIFESEGEYKRFDINLLDENTSNNFEWTQGDNFTPPTLPNNYNEVESYRDEDDDGVDGGGSGQDNFSITLYPNPFN